VFRRADHPLFFLSDMRNITNLAPEDTAKTRDRKQPGDLMNKAVASLFTPLLFSLCACIAHAQETAKQPYGTSKFAPYADIEEVKQLKAVYDFYFADPNSISLVLSAINSLMAMTAEYGPHEIEPLKVVVVSHGPELVAFAKRNYGKYREIADRAASLAQQGVQFEVCRGAAASLNLKAEDFHGFVTVIPSGPYALTYWQMKGYALIPGGFTLPQRYRNEFNKGDYPEGGSEARDRRR